MRRSHSVRSVQSEQKLTKEVGRPAVAPSPRSGPKIFSFFDILSHILYTFVGEGCYLPCAMFGLPSGASWLQCEQWLSIGYF